MISTTRIGATNATSIITLPLSFSSSAKDEIAYRRAAEARLLCEETAPPVRLAELAPAWTPLLADDSPNAQTSGTMT
jgi:hypothetical protein